SSTTASAETSVSNTNKQSRRGCAMDFSSFGERATGERDARPGRTREVFEDRHAERDSDMSTSVESVQDGFGSPAPRGSPGPASKMAATIYDRLAARKCPSSPARVEAPRTRVAPRGASSRAYSVATPHFVPNRLSLQVFPPSKLRSLISQPAFSIDVLFLMTLPRPWSPLMPTAIPSPELPDTKLEAIVVPAAPATLIPPRRTTLCWIRLT